MSPKIRSKSDHKIAVKMLDRYHWILRSIEDGIPLNCAEIADRLNCSSKTAQRYLNQMRRDGHRLVYIPKLRGWILSKPLKRISPDPCEVANILRRALRWARNKKTAAGRPIPWIFDAEQALKKYDKQLKRDKLYDHA